MKDIKVKNLLLTLSIIAVFISFISVFPFTSPVINIVFILSIAIGIWKELKNIEEIVNRKVLTAIALSGTFFFLSHIGFNNLVIPVTETLLFLLSIKFIDKKESRDFYQILGLSLILFAATGTLTFDIQFLILFIIEAIVILLGTITLTYYSESEKLILKKKDLKLLSVFSVFFFLVSIPLTILFFALLPRTQTPVFNIKFKSYTGATGFSNTVNLGSVRNIQQIDAIVMRITTDKLLVPPYFRSITFEKFERGIWKHINLPSKKTPEIEGTTIRQTVILEPYGFKNLPLINIPTGIIGIKATRSPGFFFKKPTPVRKRVKYSGISVLSNKIPDTLTEKERIIYTGTKNIDKEVKTFLEKEFKNISEKEIPFKLLLFFRQNYRYSLSALPTSLKDFLLNNKAGNCEFFATAAAITFRLKHIPARVVGGFYKGEYNPFGNYYIVKDKDAHVWVEYYLNGAWHHFEPTFGIPEKTKKQEKETVNTKERKKTKRRLSLKEKLSFVLDTINYYWINSIINYDFSTQVKTAKKITESAKSFKLPNFKNLKIKKEYLFYMAFFIIPFIVAWIIMKKQRNIVELFYKTMEKKGYKRKKNEPLELFVKRIKEKSVRKKAEKFVKLYEEKFYKDKKVCCQTLEELRKILKEIEKEGKSGD